MTISRKTSAQLVLFHPAERSAARLLEVRGVVYMNKIGFAKLNAERSKGLPHSQIHGIPRPGPLSNSTHSRCKTSSRDHPLWNGLMEGARNWIVIPIFSVCC